MIHWADLTVQLSAAIDFLTQYPIRTSLNQRDDERPRHCATVPHPLLRNLLLSRGARQWGGGIRHRRRIVRKCRPIYRVEQKQGWEGYKICLVMLWSWFRTNYSTQLKAEGEVVWTPLPCVQKEPGGAIHATYRSLHLLTHICGESWQLRTPLFLEHCTIYLPNPV